MTREEAKIQSLWCRIEALDEKIKASEQEPCEDAVSRQAVSYIIKSHIHEIITESGTDKNAHTNAVLRAIVNLVETMPSVTPTECIAKVTFDKDELQKIVDEKVKDLTVTQEWIPVSERLPEKKVEVLATTEWGAVTIAEMFCNNEWLIYEGSTKADAEEIIAWMPLPTPYKAETRG